jgi:hypothetical protein
LAEDEVIAALQATLIRGRKARVERYKPPTERPATVRSDKTKGPRA